MLLNFGFDPSFDIIKDSKLIREKTGEANSTKAYVTNGVALFSCFVRPLLKAFVGIQFIVGRSPYRISAQRPAILTEVSPPPCQFLQAYTGILL
jgi:hypothetical protein